MKLIFLGSGPLGLPTLQRLHDEHDVRAVVSQPDRPAGRKRLLTPTPVAQWAQHAGLNVVKAPNANDPAVVDPIAALQPDAAVVIAFGQKLSPLLIETLGGLCVNLHASLLPQYRGAAPIQWAMIHGESHTGLSVIGLAQRMDAGPIYAQATTPIDPVETAGELHERLSRMGPAVIAEVLADFENDRLSPRVQDESQATQAPKLSKTDGSVDFHLPARDVRCRVHGLTPWPGVTVQWHRQGQAGPAQPLSLRRVRDEAIDPAAPPGTVLDGQRVATGNGVVQLLEVQAPGGRPMKIDDFVRGHPMSNGDRLTSLEPR